MRKTPYLVSLGTLLVTVVIIILSIVLPDWLYAESPPNVPHGTHVRYGLYQRCQSVPSSGSKSSVSAPLTYGSPPSLLSSNTSNSITSCHPFPLRSSCESLGEEFCVLWTTAGYVSQISLVFGLAGLVILAIVSSKLSTRARRRGAWKLVSGAVVIQGALQIVTMAIVARLYITAQDRFNDPNTRLYASFYLCMTSIVLSIMLTAGLVYTGLAARAGHRWAAGRRPYEPIPDLPSASVT